MHDLTISFIGGGNMAESLIAGLIADGMAGEQICVADPDNSKCERLNQKYGVRTTTENHQAAKSSDILVLAVKPQMLDAVCLQLVSAIEAQRHLVLSVLAGIRVETLNAKLNKDVAVIRAMPNTPAMLQTGATALFANDGMSQKHKEEAEFIMRAVGLTIWVDDESHMDIVTALSGSGPAYFFLLMEVLEKSAAKLGLPQQTAHLLTLQTALGAAKMALESQEDCEVLRKRVTSPGGTTEKALAKLFDAEIETLYFQALSAAQQRSIELADLLSGKS